MFAAVLDTSVLWPSRQRDFLLSLAIEGLYRPLWSDAILEELEYHEAAKLETRGSGAEEAAAAAAHLIAQMRQAFDDAVVTGWEPLDGSYGLPDPDDEHVVAAAVVGGAGVIVTSNGKDFPEDRVPGYIQVVSPAQFAADTVAVSPTVARRAVETMAKRLNNPPVSIDEALALLADRYNMSDAVALLREG
ncbi:PIN domain-containing protein [Rhodococcus aetherivorans]|uniref:PIN domain-containing protein n=1 Tax=Rhodococcus aetherivorans TaxID=191292 RepID=UPI002949EBD0|nr:PIN domain-containing protein [Rhodococcus aetherivorans]MDV6296942.1 PIN domain-containing protein [Rhodococcus aetherivorans]